MPDGDDRVVATIRCTDAVGRQRDLQIAVTRLGHVALIVPAGGSATVTPDRIELLKSGLDAARKSGLGRGRTP